MKVVEQSVLKKLWVPDPVRSYPFAGDTDHSQPDLPV
jgi:hypothetical protein